MLLAIFLFSVAGCLVVYDRLAVSMSSWLLKARVAALAPVPTAMCSSRALQALLATLGVANEAFVVAFFAPRLSRLFAEARAESWRFVTRSQVAARPHTTTGD